MKDFTKIFFNQFVRGLFCLLVLTPFLYGKDPHPVDLKIVHGGQEKEHVLVGLVLDILPEWHVYAPHPQEEEGLGFEPTVTWDGSKNLQEVNVLWPVAQKEMLQGDQAFVYQGKVLIPLKLLPDQIKDPITLNLQVSLLACASLCVPIEETLTLVIDSKEKANPIFKALKDRETAYEGFSLLTLLAIALLGGFILNFMPCVLPVLSLKIMSLVKQSKKTQMHHAKQGFFITGLGILASFLLLALVTVILKESGKAFGWGIHFQNPHFLLFVFLVLIAFSASLWGVFEIDLPSGLGNWLIGHEGKGRIKDFLSGVFATLLATPCSAPFVGTALSFALARNMGDIFLVFFFLGLGFAVPYFLVSTLPQRFIKLPKPGVWMVRLQMALGGLLILTAIWIGWILSFHLPLWVLGVSTLLALIAVSLFWIKHHKNPSLKAWLLATPLFLLAWGLSWLAYEPNTCNPAEDYAQSSSYLDFWKPFESDAIQSFVRQGKIVFVDATAEWCVTCAVNKSLVLNDPQITSLLSQPDVIAMRADWTKQDPCITKFLHDHGRYGIPFNIVFGPHHPEGIPLPEILSVSAVKEAFKKAGLPEYPSPTSPPSP